MRATIGWALVLLAAACGDDRGTVSLPAPPLNWGPASSVRFPAEEGGLLGAWFFCKQVGCSELDDEGLVLRADGSWRFLDAPGSSLDPTERYCEESEGGRYSWNGTRLELWNLVGTDHFVFTVKLAEDLATFYSGGKIQGILKRVHAGSSGSCDEVQPLPTP